MDLAGGLGEIPFGEGFGDEIGNILGVTPFDLVAQINVLQKENDRLRDENQSLREDQVRTYEARRNLEHQIEVFRRSEVEANKVRRQLSALVLQANLGAVQIYNAILRAPLPRQ